MPKWKKVKLSHLGEIVGGATPSTKREDYYNGDIAWLTPKDLAGYNSRYISKGERCITKEGLDSCSAKIMPKGSVLFTSRAPIGYIVIAENEICTNQGFKSIVPYKDTDPLFLFYLLKYNKERIESMGSGTTFKEISGAVMKNIEVVVPDYEEQKSISTVLASIDDLIEKYSQVNKNLEAQVQAIYKCWFVDFEPWGGVRPKDWREGILSEIVEVKDGTHDSPKPVEIGFPLVTSKHLERYSVKLDDTYSISKVDFDKINQRSKVDTYDILISMIGTVGTISLVTNNPVKYAIKNVGLIKTSLSDIHRNYIFDYMNSKKAKEYIDASMIGSTQKYISLAALRNFPIAVIPSERLCAYNNLVQPIHDLIINNTKSSYILGILRDSLLFKLISGEIRVTEVE